MVKKWFNTVMRYNRGKDMKKNLFILSILIGMTTGIAFAEGMVFDPTVYQSTTQTGSVNKTQTNASIQANTQASSSFAQDAVSGQSSNFNNALYELDSAQVNIRNELLEYKAKYQEVDTQYKLIKEQRKVLDNQIKTIEKRIREIERSKSQIRKTMI